MKSVPFRQSFNIILSFLIFYDKNIEWLYFGCTVDACLIKEMVTKSKFRHHFSLTTHQTQEKSAISQMVKFYLSLKWKCFCIWRRDGNLAKRLLNYLSTDDSAFNSESPGTISEIHWLQSFRKAANHVVSCYRTARALHKTSPRTEWPEVRCFVKLLPKGWEWKIQPCINHDICISVRA